MALIQGDLLLHFKFVATLLCEVKHVIAETSAKTCVWKNATSLYGDTLRPSKFPFFVYITTVFATNATRPSTVAKLILKADLLVELTYFGTGSVDLGSNWSLADV